MNQAKYTEQEPCNATETVDYSNIVTQQSKDYDNDEKIESIEDCERYAKQDKIKGIMTIVGAAFLMMYLGCFFLWGNISIYVLSYFYQFNNDLSLGFVFSVDMFLVGFQCIGYNIGTYLFNKLRLPVKLLIFLGCALALAGVYFSSFTKSLLPFFSLYCLLNGIGCGIGYLIPLVCSWEYFPEKKGLVTGIVLGCYGFGSFIFSEISTQLVNPNHENPTIETPDATFFDSDVADNVPYMLRTLVYIWCSFVVIAILLITRKPKYRVQQAEAKRLLLDQQKKEEERNDQEEEFVPEKLPEIAAVRFCWFSIRFWQYNAFLWLGTIFSSMLMYSFKVFGENNGISDSTLTWAASIGSGLVNGLSRIIMGYLVDKIKFKYLLASIFITWTTIGCTVFWMVQIPWLYFAAVIINYFCTGGFYAIIPSAVNNTFGINCTPQIYSIILCSGFVSSVTNFLITTFVLPATGYLFIFLLGASGSFISLLILIPFQERLDVKNLEKYNGVRVFETDDNMEAPSKLSKESDQIVMGDTIAAEQQYMAEIDSNRIV